MDLTIAKSGRPSDSVTLATALFVDPSTVFHLTPPAPLAVDPNAAGNGSVALRARRDVAAAEARVEQARLGVSSAKHAYLPQIAATGSGQLIYEHDIETGPTYLAPPAPATATTVSNSPTELLQGSLTLTLPIFDAVVNANVKAAEATLGEAQAGLEQIALSARSDAIQTSRQARNARAVLEQSQRLVEGTAANLSVVEDRYAAGLEGPLVLADAQREDALARHKVVTSKLAYDVAAVRLLASLARASELLKVQ